MRRRLGRHPSSGARGTVDVEESRPRSPAIKILIADDDLRCAQQLGRQIRLLGHDALLASDFETLLELAEARNPDVVIAHLGMLQGGPAQLSHALDAINLDPVLILTCAKPSNELAIEALREGAVDLVARPLDQAQLLVSLQRVEHLARMKQRARDAETARLRVGMSREHMVAFMIGLANVIDAKSQYTREHSDRVAQRSKVFARYLNLSSTEVENIAFGAKLHDVGKVGVPDAILNSPNALSKEEREIMQRHPSDGARMLRPIEILHDIIPIAERHHENWDGTGYPDGMRGTAIPFAARLVKLVDYFDAITSIRPYRKPVSDLDACKILESEAGRQLDPELVEQFVHMVRSGLLSMNNVSAVIPAEYRLVKV
jgi:putative two-component system response regulator